MDNQNLLVKKGIFKKILKGGQDFEWKFSLALFKPENEKEILIYIKNEKIRINFKYEIEFKYNQEWKSFSLLNLKAINNEFEEIKNIVLKSYKGEERLKKIIDIYGENWFENLEKNNYCNLLLTPKTVEKIKEIKNDTLKTFFIKNGINNLYKKLEIIFENLTNKTINANTILDLYNLQNNNLDFYQIKKYLTAIYIENKELPEFEKLIESLIFTFLNIKFNNNNTLIDLDLIEITYFIDNEIKEIYENKLNFNLDINNILIRMLKEKKIFIFETKDNTPKITTKTMFEIENTIYKRLFEILNKNSLKKDIQVDHKTNWSNEQYQAYKNSFINNINIISGAPGTGKTFLIKEIYYSLINKFNLLEKEIQIVSLTGRTIHNLVNKGLHNSKTIHSFLKFFDFEEKNLQKNIKRPEIKVLIIDEFSLVNNYLFYSLLNACVNLEKIILVGDSNQLPSIGPGNIFSELINSQIFNTTYLSTFFRTDNINIIKHFSAIQNNKLEALPSEQVNFFESDENLKFSKILEKYIEKVNKYNEINVAILAPTNRLVDEINLLIQDYNKNLYKRNSYALFYNKKIICINDRVIQIVNNYEKDVYNGEIGNFKIIDNKYAVDFGYKIIFYEDNEIKENLKLAYATTVHKFQGSEIDCVILPIFSENEFMLTKRMLYTATSRAIKEIVLIGEYHTYSRSILHNKKENHITTILGFLLKGEINENDSRIG
ncbi:AAA family ATPase [Mycoplasma sp. 744]|uniref:ATP-dependent DNA helicase n=1 Tax=Mycoplasma sp. 744 TaxID=3108531 RepID=UPI002B1E5476|nr:AAA family ATPase [Mycoplasma sp. 744]MEA4115249.1 AAA family ATPase [Mycoplasma sp. 744]